VNSSLLRELNRDAQVITQPVRRPEIIHALTSLRFFAALYVVLEHTIWSFFPAITHEGVFANLLSLGFVSSFFFLFSGYILGVVYLRRGGPVRPLPFFGARFARVYPLFLLTLLLDTPLVFLRAVPLVGLKNAVVKTGISFAGTVVMLQGWNLRFRYIDFPNWSLSAEMIFYLIFPFLGATLWKLRGARLWVVGAVLYFGGQALVLETARHISGDYAYRVPILHMTTFALGILLARWQTLDRERDRERGSRPLRTNRFRASLITVLALVCLGAVAYRLPRIPNSNLRDGLLAPLFLGIIWAFTNSQWLPARLMSAPWLVVLGQASYGLYLFHIPVFDLFEFFGWNRTAALFPVYLAVSIGLSVVSFYKFETPVRKWILRRGQIWTASLK
jgi:peptidoglycan/LPS O-acetylase OafA/YrhL